jgi:hypothetical protein
MLDRLVTKIGLDRSGIHTVVGQLEAASMPEHVRVDLHVEACSLTSALDHRLKAYGRSCCALVGRRQPEASAASLTVESQEPDGTA